MGRRLDVEPKGSAAGEVQGAAHGPTASPSGRHPLDETVAAASGPARAPGAIASTTPTTTGASIRHARGSC